MINAVESISTWQTASTIVVLQTLRCSLQIKCRYVGWCQSDVKRKDGFSVDGPVCILAKVALRLDGTLLFVKIDDVLALKLSFVGPFLRNYDGKTLLCAQPKPLRLRNNGKDDELNLDDSVYFLDCSEDEKIFSVSPVSFYIYIDAAYFRVDHQVQFLQSLFSD